MRKLNATAEGVRDAFDFWLSQHNVSVPDIFELAIRAAVSAWLDDHAEEIVEAIAKGAKS